MANNRQRRYRTYGNVAYQSGYGGSAAPKPQREEQQGQPQKRPQVQPRKKVFQRPLVQVREANAYSPFAVIGFLAVALCTVLLLISNARLMVLHDQTVTLRNQLKTLQAEQESLIAEYELAFDLDAIESQLTTSGAMVKLQPHQMTYLDVFEPDSVVRYDKAGNALDDLFHSAEHFFSGLLS